MKQFRSHLLTALLIILILILSAVGLFIVTALDHSSFQEYKYLYIFGSLGISAIVFGMLAYKVVIQLMKPLDDAAFLAKEMAEGHFDERVYEYDPHTNGHLNYSLNRLARNLQQMMHSYEIQQDLLGTVIENIGSGLIFINDKGHVSLVNQTYKETFQSRTEDWFEKRYEEALPYRELIDIVKDTFMLETIIRKQLLLPIRIERRHFDVYSAPILASDQKLKGVVLVFHDITELKKLEQMRKDFVANVSHELKTPVTSLKGFAETLLDGAMEDEEFREKFLTIIWKESDQLQSLIYDLLELSKIEQVHFEPDWQSVNLTQLLDDMMDILTERATEKRIQLITEVKGKTVIQGDPYRLRQVFINIINNAISYSPEGSRVFVTLQEYENTVAFITEDTGIGIDTEEIPRIFERFYRVDKARSRNSGGTGLGLAIVKHLVESHQGQIDVASKKGVGTTFTITFRKHRGS